MLAAWWRFYSHHWTSFLFQILGDQSGTGAKRINMSEFARRNKHRVGRAYILGMCLLHLSIFSFWFHLYLALPFLLPSALSFLAILFTPLLMVATFYRTLGKQAIWSFVFCPISLYLFDSFLGLYRESLTTAFLLLLFSSVLHNIIFSRFLSYTPISPTRSEHIETSELSYFSRSEAIFVVFFPTYGALFYLCQTVGTFLILSIAASSLTYTATTNQISSQRIADLLVVLIPVKLLLHLLASYGYLSNFVAIGNIWNWVAIVVVPFVHNASHNHLATTRSLMPLLAALPLLLLLWHFLLRMY